jgi:hypothetical protein
MQKKKQQKNDTATLIAALEFKHTATKNYLEQKLIEITNEINTLEHTKQILKDQCQILEYTFEEERDKLLKQQALEWLK